MNQETAYRNKRSFSVGPRNIWANGPHKQPPGRQSCLEKPRLMAVHTGGTLERASAFSSLHVVSRFSSVLKLSGFLSISEPKSNPCPPVSCPPDGHCWVVDSGPGCPYCECEHPLLGHYRQQGDTPFTPKGRQEVEKKKTNMYCPSSKRNP